MTKIALITDDTKLRAAIDGIKKRGKVLDHDIQVAGVSAIDAFAKHGNVFYVNALYKALSKGARHTAFTAWMFEFGGVSANTGDNKEETPFVKDANKTANVEGAMATVWTSFKPSASPDEVLDVLALVQRVIAKASKPKDGQEVKHSELLEALQALVAPLVLEETEEA